MLSILQLFHSFYLEKMASAGKSRATLRVPNEVRSPPLPAGYMNRTSNRVMKIIKNITIEPALFIIAFSSSMESIASKFFNLQFFTD